MKETENWLINVTSAKKLEVYDKHLQSKLGHRSYDKIPLPFFLFLLLPQVSYIRNSWIEKLYFYNLCSIFYKASYES